MDQKLGLLFGIVLVIFISSCLSLGTQLAIYTKVARVEATVLAHHKEVLKSIKTLYKDEKEKLATLTHYEKRFLTDIQEAIDREKAEAERLKTEEVKIKADKKKEKK